MSKEAKRAARTARARAKKMQKRLGWLVFIGVIIGGLWWLSQGDGGGDRATITTPDDTTVVFQDDQVKGGENARVTLVEYGDFQCPACGRIAPVVKEIGEQFGEQLRIVYRHYPLTSIHPHAQSSAQASEAAGLQGKFWEMHDILFERQSEWGQVNTGPGGAPPIPMNVYIQYAEELGLDTDRFAEDFNSSVVKEKIARDLQDATSRSLRGTPSFLLNGQYINTPGSAEEFAALIQAAVDNAPAPEVENVSVHEHADFAVYLNGEQVDFSKEEYQSNDEDHKHEYTHLHDGVGHIIHKHRTGVSIGELFDSIGMNFSQACFALDTGEQFCNSNTKSLKFFVNGEENSRFGDYEIADLDQILISYGPKDEDVSEQLESLTDEACIYSETCPERGTPPEEACVGGIGSECEADGHSHDGDEAHEEDEHAEA